MTNLISDLNIQQQQAVISGLGPILVLAGPGSGKTRVLTRRVAYLISTMGVNPFQILAVTFTNKAAREMESRVLELIKNVPQGLSMGTFHSICARILRRESKYLPIQSNFVIFDQDDQIRLVKKILKDLNIDEKRFQPNSVHSAISKAKNDLLFVDGFPVSSYRDEVIKRVYKHYQESLLVNNAVDFDDLLLWTAYLLEEHSNIKEKYARRYEHVLVDEFQDTNIAQYEILKNITSFHHNLFVVGDADQSIYRWRGADYRNVIRFEKDFTDTQVILLEHNYRSTQNILDVATSVINKNPYRVPKNLFTDRGQGEKVSVYEALNDRIEADFIVETIVNLVAKRKAEAGDFAIMYRTNAQSRLIEEALLGRGLPYRLIGAQRFYGRREIKDTIAFLRLVHNPIDEVSLSRIINVPPRKIGDKTMIDLHTVAQNAKIPMGLFLQKIAETPNSEFHELFSSRSINVLEPFGRLLSSWISLRDISTPLELIDRIITDIDYHSYIDDGTEEGFGRWENVMEFRRLASEFKDEDLTTFLEQIALVSDQDTLREDTSIPTLLTLHAAKGLEFPIVMIAGLNEGTLPHSRSFDEPEEMMEERRLFYVGITRAQDQLYLIYSQERSAYGFSEPTEPSRFLYDIPAELLSNLNRSSYHMIGQSSSKKSQWQTNRKQKDLEINKTKEQKYLPGMMVEHPHWGEGLVLNSRIDDEDEIVDIFFNGVGQKKVASSLANLVITKSNMK
jgi:DNA helicase II / ATP-dependent DNA helicase PcrA